MNNNFRPLSLSEGFIYEKNDILLRKFSKNDLTDIYIKIDEVEEYNSPNTKINSPNSFFNLNSPIYKTNFFLEDDIQRNPLNKNSNGYMEPLFIENDNIIASSPNKYLILDDNEEELLKIKNEWLIKFKKKLIKYIPSKRVMIYCLKKLFMFMIHLLLISIFEIIFFFSIVSIYENEAIVSVIISFFNEVPYACNEMNEMEKLNFTNIFNLMLNTTDIDNNANMAVIKRKAYNHNLFINAWMYFLIIVGINIVLFIIKYFYKIKINFKKIILENIVMILILGIYEYLFFKSIILLYQNISQSELIKIIVGQFNTCLV